MLLGQRPSLVAFCLGGLAGEGPQLRLLEALSGATLEPSAGADANRHLVPKG